MKDLNKREFLFECEDCSIVLSITTSDHLDIESVMNNKITLDCPCGGICRPLFN